MARKKNDEETTVVEEKPLYRRGQAVPVDPRSGAPALDAPEAPVSDAQESTAAVLVQQEGSAESKMPAHVGSHQIGAVNIPPLK